MATTSGTDAFSPVAVAVGPFFALDYGMFIAVFTGMPLINHASHLTRCAHLMAVLATTLFATTQLAQADVPVAESKAIADVNVFCSAIAAVKQDFDKTANPRIASIEAIFERVQAARSLEYDLSGEMDDARQSVENANHQAANWRPRFDAYQAARNKFQTCRDKYDDKLAERIEDRLEQLKSAANVQAEVQQAAVDVGQPALPVDTNAALAARVVKVKRDENMVVADGESLRVFAIAHADRFVFLRAPIVHNQYDVRTPARTIPRGEAVLIIDAPDEDNASDKLTIMTIDGFEMELPSLSLLGKPVAKANVMPLQASWLSVATKSGHGGYGDIVDVYDQGAALYGPPAFLKLAPADANVDVFLALRDKTLACYDRVMAKLDPSGQRSKFNLVTGTHVEALNAVYDRQACTKCNCKGLNAKQRALAKSLLAPLQQIEFKRYKPIVDRVTQLFAH